MKKQRLEEDNIISRASNWEILFCQA